MGRYIIRRLLWVIVLLIVVSAVTFIIFYELPSADPAVLRAGRSPNPALIASLRFSPPGDAVHSRPSLSHSREGRLTAPPEIARVPNRLSPCRWTF